jgi:2-polyprenyl-3-methyl-5-hydroxy-6-metoxy-1,4-benzoquinol methylase
MDALERLSRDELRERTLLASHHLHRYHLAAALCGGLRVLDLGCGVGYGSRIIADAGAASVRGVDIDSAAVEEAERLYGEGSVSFDAADAVQALRRLDPDQVDAIVAFEVLEHLERFDAVMESLEELAAGGMRLLLSIPNSRTFGERNPFHVIDFDYDSARSTFERFPGMRLLFQHVAEGSVLIGAGERLEGHVDQSQYAEPEYANTFVAVVGFDSLDVAEVVAHLNVVAAPNHNRYMLGLQAGNRELTRVNDRLARDWLGKSDAAAASVIGRFAATERALRETEEQLRLRVTELEQELLSRVDELTAEILRVGDEREELRRLLETVRRKKAVRMALALDSLRPSQWRRS